MQPNSPGWLAAVLATVMLVIAACCAARLAIWRLRGRAAEPEADALHVVMGVAMAGMLEPRLSPVPSTVWVGVFAVAASWFGLQALRAGPTRQRTRWQCAQPAPHAVESAAMIYMLWPARPGGNGKTMAMPAMGGHAAPNPALALVFALFMVGYILWTTDQLATTSRASRSALATASGAAAERGLAPVLAPKLAASYKIVMSAAMGYMLLAML